MNRRNLTTTFMVAAAGLLLFGGVTLAREQQIGDDHRNQVVDSLSVDDNGQGADDVTRGGRADLRRSRRHERQ